MKCIMEDSDQLVHISNQRIGWQQVRNKTELKSQEKGHILEANTKLSQDSAELRIFWQSNS